MTRRKRRGPENPDWHDLAVYNAEVRRGIVHRSEYDSFMAGEQRRFNEWSIEQLPHVQRQAERALRRRLRLRQVLGMSRRTNRFRLIGRGSPEDTPPDGVREPRSPPTFTALARPSSQAACLTSSRMGSRYEVLPQFAAGTVGRFC
jgi:hypothetical protein